MAPTPEEVPTLSLRWQAPQGCGSEAQVRARVDELLEDAPTRPLEATGIVDPSGKGWSLSLTFEGTNKRFEAATCEELVDAAAVILSLALGPDAAPPESKPEPFEPELEPESEPSKPEPDPSAPEPEPPRQPPVEARPQPLPPAVVAQPRPPRTQGLARFDVGFGVGVTPTLGTGRLAAGVRGPWGRAEVAGSLWTPADAEDPRGDGHRLVVTMGLVTARGCDVLGSGRIGFPLCGGFGVGALRVGDQSPSGQEVTHRAWPAVVASAGLVWSFRPAFALWASAEGTVGVWPLEVALRDSTESYAPGLVAIRATVGIEVHFPSRISPRAGKSGR